MTRKTALLLGISGIAGSLALFAGDMLFYYSGDQTDLLATMATVSSQRIILSGLTALLATWLYVLGSGQIYYAFQPAKRGLRLAAFLSFAAIMIAYGVVHSAYIAIATSAQNAHALSANLQSLTDLALAANQALRTATYIPFAIFSLLFIFAVWKQQTHYPRWMLFFHPLIPFLLNGLIVGPLAGKAKVIIGGGYLNLILLLFFTASTIALWRNQQQAPVASLATARPSFLLPGVKMKKSLSILAVILLLVIIVVGGLVWRMVSSPWPKTNGELTLPGLEEQVTVIRDDRGVPHIYARNAHDLFMAQGFVHAQDRFWQMALWRRVGAGRLSEVFGESQVDTDRFLRALGIAPAAQRSYDSLDVASQEVLQAYAQGVNAYIDQNQGNLPLEFKVLGLSGAKITPEPWKPVDTITWATLMSMDLGGNYKKELRRAQLLNNFGRGWMNELMNQSTGESYPAIVSQNVDWRNLGLDATLAALPAGLFLRAGAGVGSNNWVVSGEHTDTGKPLLANDPHLGIQMPSIWYENGLHCQPAGADCPYDVMGFSFASVPGVVVGHNQRIAWGVTNAGPDVQDLYIERINPENPNQYEVNGQWQDMEIRQEAIAVAGQDDPMFVTIRSTRHGPIINDVAYGPDSDWAYGWQPLALKWTALGSNRLIRAILELDRAADWQGFRQALTYWDAPSQNFVYADVDGNIGYQMPGLIPIRAGGDGTLPVPGWNDDYAWTGFIPFDELPSAYNPPEGYILSANNRIVGDDYPYLINKYWITGYRSQRIKELITSKDVLTVADFQQFQGDNANLFARNIIPALADVPLQRPEVAAQRDKLLQWDTQMDKDSAEALFFSAFYYHLLPILFEDELHDSVPHVWDDNAKRLMEKIITQGDAHWWDDITTPEQETREAILARALDEAYDDLIERAGKNPDKWRWGALHTATFRNQTLGQSGVGLVEAIFNRGPVQTGGGDAIINATSWGGEEPRPFDVVWIPSLRMIVDMADLSRSLDINTTGQSGHPYHKHYDDQMQDWANIRYRPMLWQRAQVEAHAAGTLRLLPQK